jgi:hypothetical protein
MRYKQIAFFAVLGVYLAMSVSTLAHHGYAAYDNSKTVSLTGTVTYYEMANPHSTLKFDVKDESGKIQNWAIEFGTVRDLKKIGWTQDSLKPGDQIAVTLHPAKNGATVGVSSKITYADGREISGVTAKFGSGATP